MEGPNGDGSGGGAGTAVLRRWGIALSLETIWLAFLVWMAVRGG